MMLPRPGRVLVVTGLLLLLAPHDRVVGQAVPDGAVCAQAGGAVWGGVRSSAAGPVAGADVFLISTLEGSATDQNGCFTLTTSFVGPTTLVVRALGYQDASVQVELPMREPIAVELVPAAIALPPLTVRAGTYVVGPDERAELTSLDVVTTPGTAADVLRAIQTLAGVQTVGDGASLIVRGGDAAETKVILDGVRVLAPYRYESPTGSAFGAFDPFALDGIFFSAGGFGARHGDALSGVVELTTLGRPETSSVDLTASLAAISGRVAIAASDRSGFRLTGTRSHTGLLFDLNRVDANFTRVPEGSDLSLAGAWEYRATGKIKVFGIAQKDQFGVEVTDPSFAGAFESDNATRSVVVSGQDVVGRLRPQWSVGYSTRARSQSFGAFLLDEEDRFFQARVEVAWDIAPRVLAHVGVESERRRSGIGGSFPTDADARPGAIGSLFDSEVRARRSALFGEVEWRASDNLAVVPGVRFDRSNLSNRTTVDPRFSATYAIKEGLTATVAWGLYHQVPAPLSYEPTVGIVDLPPMRAQHWAAGLTFAPGDALVRIEGYRKTYRELAAADRDAIVRGQGVGSSEGVDLFAKSGLGWGFGGRISYSLLRAKRTDPNTGRLSRSPFDITHTLVIAADRPLGPAWTVSASLRQATGRPFTPVSGAAFDPDQQVWQPQYDEPYSERFPDFRRIDLSITRLHSFWTGNLTVFFASITNVLDRRNVTRVEYSPDYSSRTPVDSPFRRTLYVGATLSTPF